jgi:hypothetical protein
MVDLPRREQMGGLGSDTCNDMVFSERLLQDLEVAKAVLKGEHCRLGPCEGGGNLSGLEGVIGFHRDNDELGASGILG